MALTLRYFVKGLQLRPTTDESGLFEGSLLVNGTSHIFKVHLNGALHDVLTADQIQTITQKVIVAASNTITTAASGNLTATELNAALAELQTDIDTRATDAALTAHLNDATDAHDASSISNIPSGNLAATEVQAALNELQTDIDGRVTTTDLNNHMADTTTHGTSGNIVGTSDTQVITNKDIDGGTASNTNRMTLPKETKANLDALTRKEATVVFGTDTDKMYVDNGTALVPVGAGNGSLDIFHQNDFSVDTSAVFTTGDNATFLGGGTLAGTIADETAAPISGTRSIKYTQAAGSLNDYLASPAIALDPKQRGQEIKLVFYYKYDGADSDIKFVAYDATNSAVLTTSLDVLKSATTATRFEIAVFVPASCTSLRYGFQTAAENSGKILVFDDVELSVDPFVFKQYQELDKVRINGYDSKDGSSRVKFKTIADNDSGRIFTVDNTTYSKITFKKKGLFSASIGAYNSGSVMDGGLTWYNSSNVAKQSANERSQAANINFSVSMSFEAEVGDYLTVTTSGSFNDNATDTFFTVVAVAQVDSVITPMRNNLTDWTSYTPTFTGFGTVSTSDIRYRQVGSDIEIAGTFVSGVSTATEARLSLPNSYVSSSSLPALSLAGGTISGAPVAAGRTSSPLIEPSVGYITFNYFELATTFLVKRDGNAIASTGNTVAVYAKVPIQSLSSNSTFLAAIPISRVAYLKDVKSSGTSGGGFTSGSFLTRTLNTVEGDTAIVSLSSNQFTLQAGIYDIEASAPGYAVYLHKALIRNITDSTNDIIGTSETSDNSDNSVSRSFVSGRLTLTSAKTFELQHRCQTTSGTHGFGVPSSFSVSEVYAQIKITKVK